MCGAVQELAVLGREREHPLEQGQLAIDLGVAHIADALALVLSLDGDHALLLPVCDEGAYVGRGDVGHAPPLEERREVLLDAALHDDERALAIDRVVVQEVGGRVLELQAADLRRDWNAICNLALAPSQQVDRVLLPRAARRFEVCLAPREYLTQ
jgi:hypothetical protein